MITFIDIPIGMQSFLNNIYDIVKDQIMVNDISVYSQERGSSVFCYRREIYLCIDCDLAELEFSFLHELKHLHQYYHMGYRRKSLGLIVQFDGDEYPFITGGIELETHYWNMPHEKDANIFAYHNSALNRTDEEFNRMLVNYNWSNQ